MPKAACNPGGESAINRAVRIPAKLAQWQKNVAGESTKPPMQALELLAANPFTTAQRAIERLERLGIVQQIGTAKRDRVYCATVLLEVLEEPTRLAPGGN